MLDRMSGGHHHGSHHHGSHHHGREADCHGFALDPAREAAVRRALWGALVLNGGFLFVEAAVGC